MCEGTKLGMTNEMGCGAWASKPSISDAGRWTKDASATASASRDHGFRGLRIGGDESGSRSGGVGAVEEWRSGGGSKKPPSAVPLESRHLTWEWEGCGGILRSRRCNRQGAERARHLFRIKQRAARPDHSPSPSSVQSSRTALSTTLVPGTLSTTYEIHLSPAETPAHPAPS
jgi:hypothetical protein